MDIDRFDFRTNGEAVNYLVSKEGTLLKIQRYMSFYYYGNLKVSSRKKRSYGRRL